MEQLNDYVKVFISKVFFIGENQASRDRTAPSQACIEGSGG